MFDSMQIFEARFLNLVAKGGELNSDGTRNFAYHGKLHIKEGDVELYGYGGCKNTEVAYAYGITHALDHLIRNDYDQELEVMVLKDGFKRHIDEYTPNWIANNGKNKYGKTPDDYLVWKRLYELKEITRSLRIKKVGKWEGGKQIGSLEKLNDELLKSLPKQPLGLAYQSAD